MFMDAGLERVKFSAFGLRVANFVLKLVKIFAVATQLRLQILPSLKQNLLTLASKPKTQHALRAQK
jgi:hypothetical protein